MPSQAILKSKPQPKIKLSDKSLGMLTRRQRCLLRAYTLRSANRGISEPGPTTPAALIRHVIGTNAHAPIFRLPTELFLSIATNLYTAEHQVYHFTPHYRDPSDPGKRTWTLRIRSVPFPSRSPNLPKRYGCRVLFPIRVPAPESAHTSRTALKAAHPRFKEMMSFQTPPEMVEKPVVPEKVEIWDERFEITERILGPRGLRLERDVIQAKAKKLEGTYWLVENKWDEKAIDGWGTVWKDGRKDSEWPVGVPRVGVPGQ